jgi:hypothetical protein
MVSMRTLFDLPSITQRTYELEASWILCRVFLSSNGKFLVKAAEQAYWNRPCAKSCFHGDKASTLVRQTLDLTKPHSDWADEQAGFVQKVQ